MKKLCFSRDSMWPYFGRLWRGLLSLLKDSRHHLRAILPLSQEFAIAENELTAPPSFRVEQLFSQRVASHGKNPSKPKFAGVLIEGYSRDSDIAAPKKNEKTQLG